MNIYCIHETRDIYSLRKIAFEQQVNQLLNKDDHQLIWITSYPATFFEANVDTRFQFLNPKTSAPAKSCFFKHYDALKKIANSGELGLVLEDDVFFTKTLLCNCQRLVNKLHDDHVFYINIEYCSDDVPIWYLFHSLVKMRGTKRSGGYIVSPQAAERIVHYIDQFIDGKVMFSAIADAFISENYESAGINTYWSVKPLVFQGSKTGRFSSDLSARKTKAYYQYYELAQYTIMPIINKVRAIFRKKIHQRVLTAIK